MKRISLFTALFLLTYISNAQLVTNYAGTGTQGTSTSGTTKLSTNFDLPWGAALDGQGNMWLTTEGGHEIKMLQLSTGNIYNRSGAYGVASYYNATGVTARFDGPRGIAVGPGDTIYIADYNNGAIRKMSPFLSIASPQTVTVLAGQYTAYSPNSGYANGASNVAQFNGPSDLAVDASGNVYVADANNHAIRKITPSGQVTTVTGGPTMQGFVDGTLANAKFSVPTGIFLAANGDIYVADKGNARIRKISIANNSVSTVVSGLWSPTDVIFINNVYYINDFHRIYKYSGNTLSTFAGSTLTNQSGNVNAYGTNARFNTLGSIFYNSSDGFIYVADQYNHQYKKVGICTGSAPTITLTGNDTLCTGDSAILAGPSTGYIKYQWSNGKTTPSITVKTAGTYTLTVTASDSCTYTTNSITITLLNPVSTITYSTPTAFCSGDSIVLKGPAGYTAYAWSTGATTQNITLKTSDTVTLTVYKFFCSATSQPVKVRVKPVPTSTFTCKDTACLSSNITVTYTGTAASTATYTWNFGGGQIMSGTGKGPYTIRWGTTGIKTITCSVKDTNLCSSVVTSKTVVVMPLPTSTFTVQATPICALTNDLISYTGNGTSKCKYNWTFDTATIISGSGMGPYTVYWTKAGTKSVSLIVTDTTGCISAKSTKSVVITKTPTSTFNSNKTSLLINENATITYTGDGGTSAVYIWDFDNPSIASGSGKGPYSVAWNTGGIKTIKLNVIEIGCSSNDSLKITVNTTGTKPVPAFTANLTTLNEGQTTTFTDQSLNSPTSWKWTFNGGTPATSITANQAVKYNTAGVYSVKLVVQNSYGKDSLTKSGYITVKGKPIASFSGSPTTITAGSSVTFADESANYPTTWKWTCTGGTPLNPVVANPTVTYNTAGTFDVKLVVTNSLGADSMTKTGYIKVNPAPQKPVADFSGNKTVIKKGDSVTFTDLSTNSPTALKWTFQGGSPLTSTTASQVVKYNTVGSFDVKLKATNAFGSDSVTKIKYIQVNPVSIEDRNGEQLFSMYPSPAKEKLFVETFREFKANSVEVLDITGRIKYEIKFATMGSLISIDISLLPKGLYILRIAGENANFTGKFSKE